MSSSLYYLRLLSNITLLLPHYTYLITLVTTPIKIPLKNKNNKTQQLHPVLPHLPVYAPQSHRYLYFYLIYCTYHLSHLYL